MTFLSVFQRVRWAISLLLLSLGLLSTACGHKRLPSNMDPAQTLDVQTSDGWTLQLFHHGGEGPPVLLVHGMSANHYNWDYRAEVSPIPALREAGYSVWVGSLRGDSGTEPPDEGSPTGITFDHHAKYDAPALIDEVLERTGATDLLWIGHSMGGMLLYTSALDHGSKIRAGIAVASPATFQAHRKNYGSLRSFGFLVAARRGRVPMRAFVRLGLVRTRPVIRQLGNPDNLDREVMAGMSTQALENLPRATVRQARQWMRARDLVRLDGTPWLDRATQSEVPLLVMGAVDDHIAAEQDVAHACRIFANCRYLRLGTSTGFAVDYGHIDPVLGISAPDEIYPIILRFLEEHR